MFRAALTTRFLAILLAATGLAVAASAAQGPAPAQGRATSRDLLGVMDDGLFAGQTDVAFQAVQQLNAQVIRYDVDWPAIAKRRPHSATNPNDPAYNWSTVDRVVAKAHEDGVAVVLTLTHTPTWAGGTSRHNHPPTRGIDLRNFAYAAAARYSGKFKDSNGDLLPQVTRWEAWNEPNFGTHLSPQWQCIAGRGFWCRGGHFILLSPREYAGILKAIYAGVHAAGSRYAVREQVAGGATKPSGEGPTASVPSVSPIRFVQELAKFHPPMDAYAHHPYRVPGARCQTCGGLVTVGNLSTLIRTLDKGWPGKHLHVWITEFAAQTNPPDKIQGVTLAQQTAMLRQAVTLMRRSTRIDMLIWFLIRDQQASGGALSHGWQSGLAFVNGSKKPVWNAFASLASPAR
jgi:hypothetical protein